MANLLMPLQIERQYGASLDANYSFDTLDELKNYAITSALSYSGQILYCKENDTLYKVNNDKTDVASLGGGGGEDAVIPYIGDNGNWYIDDVDTGVVADISEIYKNIELIADPTEDNHIAKIKNIKNELYIEEERYTNEHYTLSETGLIIVADGYLSNPSTQVELSTVNSKLLSSDTHTYAVGEYVTLVPKDTVKETYSVEKYCTKDFVKGLIDGNSNIHQLSFVDVKANDVKYLDLEVGSIFTKSLIQAFKFIPGESNIVETLKSFNNADASNFNFNDEIVEFTDKGMGIKYTYELNRTKYNDDLYITEAFNKDDFTDIKSII